MIYKVLNPSGLKLSDTELSARLGCPTGEFPSELDLCLRELCACARPSFSAVRVPVSPVSDSSLCIGDTVCTSRALTKVLDRCREAVLLCATLGFGAERLLRRYSAISPALHFIADAAADAMAEALCDAAEDEILGDAAHTARFSPGYSDLPLSYVKEIVRLTDARSLMGVVLTDGFLAVPAKTVTAIIGIKNSNI